MQISRSLSEVEQQDLDGWLIAKDIQLNHRTLRKLSDVVNMALLFKNNLNGKLVDMRNYTSHGNSELKIHNWETFNLKVLRRTGLILRRPALVQLATGNLDAIKSLLHHLMCIQRDSLQLGSRSQSTPLKRQLVCNKAEEVVKLEGAEEKPTPQQSQMERQTQTETEMTESQTQTDIEPEAAAAVAVVKANEKKMADDIQKVLHLEDVIQKKD
ncbi:GH16317 [Drosophila grimshawi]|uniref:GH16317 n=1 Tax=Drosophila grimshawi TaxID=7222 RepID=B4IYA1_DROGR|nr:GH16317 [Drosophila grimshawi]